MYMMYLTAVKMFNCNEDIYRNGSGSVQLHFTNATWISVVEMSNCI